MTMWYFERKNLLGEWAPCVTPDKPVSSTYRYVMEVPADLHRASLSEIQCWARGMVRISAAEAPVPPAVPAPPVGTVPDRIESQSDDRTADNAVLRAYRVLTDAEKAQMAALNDAGAAFIALCNAIGKSRELSLAITNAEQAVMWAAKHGTK